MTMRASVLSVVLFAVACSSTPTTPTPASTQASLTATIAPNPVTATNCLVPCAAIDGSGRIFQWRVQGNMTIHETAGLGGNVDTIIVTNFNPPIVYTSDVIAQRSGTSHIAAKGILNVPVTVIYGIVGSVNASRSIVMDVLVSFTDDRGNQVSAATQWATN